jgi:hypothetical protein
MRSSIGMAERGAPAQAGLLELLAWFSPAMPTGAFSYSHGLEWAVEAGLVQGTPSLGGYVEAILRQGSGRRMRSFSPRRTAPASTGRSRGARSRR